MECHPSQLTNDIFSEGVGLNHQAVVQSAHMIQMQIDVIRCPYLTMSGWSYLRCSMVLGNIYLHDWAIEVG